MTDIWKIQHALGVPAEDALLDFIRVAEFIPFSQQPLVRHARVVAAEKNFVLQKRKTKMARPRDYGRGAGKP